MHHMNFRNSMIYMDDLGKYTRTVAEPMKQGKSEGFDSCDRPSNLTQIGFKSSILQPVWPWNLMDDLTKQ